jgi:hypothetical protein
MKPFLSALAVALLIAIGAGYVLDHRFGGTAPEAFTTSGARLTSPGDNLVRF